MTRYNFVDVEHCNMCSAPSSEFDTLGLRMNKSQGRNTRALTGVAVTIVKCKQCGLVFPNPQPIPANILDHYSGSAEDYWGDHRADSVVPPERVQRMEWIKSNIDLERPKALEVGAGSGMTLIALEKAGFEGHGLEPVPQFLKIAMQNSKLPSSRFKQATLDEAHYPSGSFDLISFGAVLEHLYDPGPSIEKVLGWLTPNGFVYGEVPFARHTIAKLINGLMRIKGTNLVTHTSPMHNPFHIYEFEEESFRYHGAKHGYEIANVDHEVCSIRHIPQFLHPLFRTWMERRKTGMQMHVLLRKL